MSVSEKEAQIEILRNLYEQRRTSPLFRSFFKLIVPKNVDLNSFELHLRYLEDKGLIKTEGSGAIITADGIDFLKQNEEKKIKIVSNDVFIVHGRDPKPVQELKIMLFEFGLNPIILHEQPNKGRTIIEKLEQEARGKGYAFVILTPDDVGCLETEISSLRASSQDRKLTGRYTVGGQSINDIRRVQQLFDSLESRARQNVVLEFGLFMGLLGRDRVCCLLKGKVESPSDMDGILYIEFKDSIKEEERKIMRELKAAGYEIKI